VLSAKRIMIRYLVATKTKVVSKADMDDAFGVFQDWLFEQKTFKVNNPDAHKSKFSTSAPVKTLPLDDVKIFHDHGRRPKGKSLENPIVVLKLPTGRYQVLDGQHRVLSKRDRKDKTVDAVVIELPWKTGAKRMGIQTYYVE